TTPDRPQGVTNMATAATLVIGARYPVRAGELKGLYVEIVSNIAEPDGTPFQRRIPVRVVREGAAQEQVYILPRLIDDGNKTPRQLAQLAAQAQAEAEAAGAAAPVVVLSPLDQYRQKESNPVPTSPAAT